MKQLKMLRELAESADRAEIQAFTARTELHDSIQEALAMGANDQEILEATGISESRLSAITSSIAPPSRH